MDKKYEILEHPAELRLKIYGKTLEELFSNAAEAMADTLVTRDKRQAQKTEKESLKIQSIDINSLLVDFLSEILAKSQINKAVYQVSSVKCQASDRQANLEAELVGYSIEHFKEDIKAVTYQDLDIRQQETSDKGQVIWQTILVFDI
jgi:SHS2 domain-containing protein